MGPETILRLAYAAYKNGDMLQCLADLTTYRTWRRRGGFEPTLAFTAGMRATLSTAGDTFAKETAEAAARETLRQHQALSSMAETMQAFKAGIAP